MILVTGAAGFIGSNVLATLEAAGVGPLVACDRFGATETWRNLRDRQLWDVIAPEAAPAFVRANAHGHALGGRLEAVVHMGAISATTERDVDALVRENIRNTMALWDACTETGVRLIYASSAATYGAREDQLWDTDSPSALAALRPLNAYGWSKKAVDDMVIARVYAGVPRPPQWAALKFFNVYGPGEQDKGDMRSVAHKLFEQIRVGGEVRLFRSDRPGVADGEQKRDFVYVKDCAAVVAWLLDTPDVSGVFNVGSGRARSFLDLARAVFDAMGVQPDIRFIDMPPGLAGQYQYFTEARVEKLRAAGYDRPFATLEEGVRDYVQTHLLQGDGRR